MVEINENTELISKKYRESFKKVKKSFNEHFKDSDEILLDPSSIAFIHNIFNKIDFENIFSDDSKIGLAGALACACTILLMVILFISKKIKNKRS